MILARLHPGGYGFDNYNDVYDKDVYDEILQFHPDTEKWTLAGNMIQAKYGHAVTTINFEDVREHCILWHWHL